MEHQLSAGEGNPFQFGAANDLTTEEVLEYYIEDFNYSRFIQSKRNIFLRGDRGSGKTMTFLYHSLDAQRAKAQRAGERPSLDRIGIYVPCNTPLIHRAEHELLDRFRAAVLSEHFLVLAIVYQLAKALGRNADLFEGEEIEILGRQVKESLELPELSGETPFHRIVEFTTQELRRTQQMVNRFDSDTFYSHARSFATLAYPFVQALSRVPSLSNSHFLVMIDDAHDLNTHQVRTLNSWIALRDHPLFSFKVATAKISPWSHVTLTDGEILEGHDFTVIDMEKPLQNERSDFGHLARQIVSRRLGRIGSGRSPEEFFPLHRTVEKGLERAKEEAREEALLKYPNGTKRQISDYVYKQHRAIYFRSRKPRANLPPYYSGFRMLVYLSTGVVRNLLEPCFWMYDKAVSLQRQNATDEQLMEFIAPSVQNDLIIEQSQRMWGRLEQGLDNFVAGCSTEDAQKINQLFKGLADLFQERLQKRRSEPQATSFSVSGRAAEPRVAHLNELLMIARKAGLLYVRTGVTKEGGSHETYYVPNRMLWPLRGLDPQGQYARVSLKASELLAVAEGTGRFGAISVEEERSQRDLFDEAR